MKIINSTLILFVILFTGNMLSAQSNCTDKYYQARDFYQKGLLNNARLSLTEIKECDDPIIKLQADLFLAQTYYDLQQFQRADNIIIKMLRKNPGLAFRDYDLSQEFIQYCSKFYTNQRRTYFLLGESRYKYYHSRNYFDVNGNKSAAINLKETGSFKSLEFGMSLAIPGTDIFVSPVFGADLTPYTFNGTFNFFDKNGPQEQYTVSLEDEYLTGRAGLFIKFNDLKERFIPSRAFINSLKGFYFGGQVFYTLQSNNDQIKNAINNGLPSELYNSSILVENDSKNFNRNDLFYAATIGYNYNIPFQGKNILLIADARYDILFNSFKSNDSLSSNNINVESTLSYPNPDRVLLLHLGIGLQRLSYKPKVKKLK